MNTYKFELKYVIDVDIDAEDLDDALAQIAEYISNNPGPSTPDLRVLATIEKIT